MGLYGSDECPEIPGLGLIPGIVTEIDRTHLAVPHIGEGLLFLRAFAFAFEALVFHNLM